jgi:hypothetical protein
MSRRRALRTATLIAAAIVSVALIAGCTPVTGSGSSHGSCAECQQLLGLYPWLQQLGLGELWNLVQEYGSNIVAILLAAVGALAG